MPAGGGRAQGGAVSGPLADSRGAGCYQSCSMYRMTNCAGCPEWKEQVQLGRRGPVLAAGEEEVELESD